MESADKGLARILKCGKVLCLPSCACLQALAVFPRMHGAICSSARPSAPARTLALLCFVALLVALSPADKRRDQKDGSLRKTHQQGGVIAARAALQRRLVGGGRCACGTFRSSAWWTMRTCMRW